MKLSYPLAVCMTCAVMLHAAPYIGYVYPAGGQQGTTLQLLVGGSGIISKNDFGHVSGEGVTVRDIIVVPNFPNPSSVQHRWILSWLENIADGKMERPPMPTLQEHLDEWRENPWWETLDKLNDLQRNLVLRDLLARRNALQSAPSIRQMAIVTVDIAADAPPGLRELRLWNSVSGVSVPRKFYVSKMPHQCEPRYVSPSRPQPPLPTIDTIPVAVDGQLMPGEVDVYKFKLEKNISYRFTALARSLLPFIGDAVPGHCQLILRLLDSDKKEVAFVDDVYFYPDPILFYKPVVAGEYTLEVRDNLYRGREDFVYEVVVDQGEPALKEYPNPVPNIPQMKYADLKRNSLDIAQPQCVTGVIANKNQYDTLRFKGRKGQALVIAVIARRNNSPLDGLIKLYDDANVKIAEADDNKEAINVGEYIQHVDPYLSMTLPKDGEYRLVLTDRTQGHGADYRYWLRIGPPMPDFAIYSTVSFVNIPVGSSARVKFVIDRKEGFTNEVKIVCDDFVMSDNVIGPTNSEVNVTFKAKDERTIKPTAVSLFAEAILHGKTVRKPITPADQMMQAFATNHLLPAGNFYATQYRVVMRKADSFKKTTKKK
ncbi:MAG: hypothetical protein WCP12_06645 [bacterium]